MPLQCQARRHTHSYKSNIFDMVSEILWLVTCVLLCLSHGDSE